MTSTSDQMVPDLESLAHDLALVAELAAASCRLQSPEQVSARLGELMRRVVGDDVLVVVGRCDPRSRVVTVDVLLGFDPIRDALVGIAGRSEDRWSPVCPEVVWNALTSARLVRLDGGVEEIARAFLPVDTAARAAAIVGRRDAYVVGCIGSEVVGGIAFLTAPSGRAPRAATVEAIARVTAAAIERLRSEAALRESGEQRRIFVEASPDPIFAFKPTGEYTYVNPAFAAGVGRPVEEIVGRTIWDVFPREEADRRFAALGEVFRTGREKVIEVRVPRPDGDRYYVTTITPVVGALGEVATAICSSKEMTARVRAEEALALERSQLLSVFDSIEECIYVSDIETYEILFVNRAMRSAFGRDLIGGICYREFQGLDAPCSFCTNAIIRAGQAHRWEHHNPVVNKAFALHDRLIRWPDGRQVRLELAIDITDRRRAEQERERLQADLFQAQKMEALGVLAGGIAHDFNNILGGILGGLSLLEFDLGDSTGERSAIRDMMALVDRGADLTKQLLGFARRGKYDVRPLDLARVVEKTSAMFGRTRKDVTIRLDMPADLDAVLVDHTQLEQVLLNLFLNAGQAMPDGGSLLVGADTVTLDEDQVRPHAAAPGRFVRLAVTDTGIGMDEATAARVFEPFFTTKGPGQGTGLGLASVHGIVRNHGGFVRVESEPGQGTTFTLFLPATARPVTPEPVRTRTPVLRGQGTILVVDDEEPVARACGRLLEKLGYRVLVATSGQEAIDLVRAHGTSLSLVLLDMIMPVMSGSQTFDRLRALAPGLKVLLCSGYSIDGQAQDILARGCQGFLQKPFDAATLSAKLREIL